MVTRYVLWRFTMFEEETDIDSSSSKIRVEIIMVIRRAVVVNKVDTLDLLLRLLIRVETARTHITLHLKDKDNQAKVHTTNQLLPRNHITLREEEDMARQLMHNSLHMDPPTLTVNTEERLLIKAIHLTDRQIPNSRMVKTKVNQGNIRHHRKVSMVNTPHRLINTDSISLAITPHFQVNNLDTVKEDHLVNIHHLPKAILQEDNNMVKGHNLDNIPHQLKTMARE